MSICVAVTGVSKAYGELRVLDAVNLSFAAGATTAIVGASGSGKTTLLQLINGLVRPDEGQVQVFDEPVPAAGDEAAMARFRRGIGYAVQGAGLFPHLTIAENIGLLPRLEGWSASRIQDRLLGLLAAMELPVAVATRYPHELSGGQQQRVGLARALVLEPRLLMLDEPFSAIDPITRVELYATFERVRDSDGVSTVLVTHDMREAVRLAQHIAVLSEGRVLQFGPVDELIAAPADEYVAKLIREQL